MSTAPSRLQHLGPRCAWLSLASRLTWLYTDLQERRTEVRYCFPSAPPDWDLGRPRRRNHPWPGQVFWQVWPDTGQRTVKLIAAISNCKCVVDFMAAYPRQTVVTPEMGLSDHLLCVFLGQHSLLPFPLTRGTWSSRPRDFINGLQISTNYSTNYSFNSSLPLSLQLILVDSEPRVWHLLAAAGKTSPPVDAPPADEAAPADRPRLPSVGFGLFSGQATGELLQGAAQRHDGIHDGSSADVEVKSLVPHNEPEMIVIGKHSRRPLQLTQSWFPHLKTDSETDSSSTQSQCTCAPHDPSLAVLLRV